MRIWLVIGACLSLGGCNLVMTQTPLFTHADEAGAPPLRSGVWADAGIESCAFDERATAAEWPSCANAAMVGGGSVRAWRDKDSKKVLESTDYVLARGEPRIMQLHLVDLSPTPGVTASAYAYLGVRPTKTDSGGRITAFSAWFVLCGPLPSQPSTPDKSGKIGPATQHPFPGLVMDKGGDTCTTSSTDALRNAAAASQALSGDLPGLSHWVRDGDR